MNTDNGITEVISINEICRLCANQNDKLIGIYSQDGINNELATKMNLYLPIKVNETDDLPLQCCWQCASTVLAWHELVVTSLEADRRLKNYQLSTEKQTDVAVKDPNFEAIILESNDTLKNEEQHLSAEDESYNSFDEIKRETIFQTPPLHCLDPQSNDTLKVSCDICKAAFISNFTLKQHLNSIHGREKIKTRRKKSEVVAPYVCRSCNKCYTRKHDLQKHIVIKHSDEINNIEISARMKNSKILEKCKLDNIYKCDFCDSKFQRTQLLLNHRRIHTQEKSHICYICGKQFNSLSAAKRHIDQFHHKIKKISCEFCDTRFDSNDKKEEHMNIHTNKRPFMCALCGKSFKQRATLFAHKIFHSEIYPYDCRWCGKKFKRKSEVKLHERTHTGEKRFSCDICAKSFSVYQNLKKHSMMHSKYTCDDCGISFGQKKLLKLHDNIHYNNKII